MYSKKYMYDAGQKSCINLIEDGYVHTFEEVLNLMNMNRKVREEAEHGLDKKMPREFRSEPQTLQYIEENLKDAEEAMRKGIFEDNYMARMKLGKYFHELEGYHWLAAYFYQSTQMEASGRSLDVFLPITSLEQQALLEESRGNTDIALKYLEKALRIADKDSLEVDNPVRQQLNEHLCRIYYTLGTEYLEKESSLVATVKPKSLKYFKKAAKLAMMSDNVENQAACHALLGKAMMKYNDDERALKSFELYIELSEKYDDNHGKCQGYFAVSEVYKRTGELEKSIEALNICQKLAKENKFDTPLIFASISLGQIATAKRQYFKANKHFEEAYRTLIVSKEEFSDKKTLSKLCKIMYGIGQAHLSFGNLVTTFSSSVNLSLPKLLSWRNSGGPFKGDVFERQDHLIDLEEIEKEDKEDEISGIIEKLMKQELEKKV